MHHRHHATSAAMTVSAPPSPHTASTAATCNHLAPHHHQRNQSASHHHQCNHSTTPRTTDPSQQQNPSTGQPISQSVSQPANQSASQPASRQAGDHDHHPAAVLTTEHFPLSLRVATGPVSRPPVVPMTNNTRSAGGARSDPARQTSTSASLRMPQRL